MTAHAQANTFTLERFRSHPQQYPLPTPSGRIELSSSVVAGFGYDEFPGYPCWKAHDEWLGSIKARHYPLHLLSNQPEHKLHSQYDYSRVSKQGKTSGRQTIRLSVTDASSRGLQEGDIVKVFNDRGGCLCGVKITADLMVGVVELPTGAWWDPQFIDGAWLDIHGNANTLTLDQGDRKSVV